MISEKIDLSKAGGRLKYSIQFITNESFYDFGQKCKSVKWRTLYNWSKKDELTFKKIEPLLNELPQLNREYIINNDISKQPSKEIANTLQVIMIEKRLEKIEKSLVELPKITDLLEKCLEELTSREAVKEINDSG